MTAPGARASSVAGATARHRVLPGTRIGCVPILWNNVDDPTLADEVPVDTLLDEIARLGYAGTQYGRGFAEGAALHDALARRGLALAEVYASFPTDSHGPGDDALGIARRRLRLLVEGAGDVLVLAVEGPPERDAWAGRVGDRRAPRLTDDGWRRLADTLEGIGREAAAAGVRTAFHPHTGTWIEAPDEVDRLMSETDPGLVPLCLDVGHHVVGGGDPVAAIERYGTRITHVHLKDVDAGVLERLRAGELVGFGAAVRARIFTELGAGVLDLPEVLRALDRQRYAGWLMVEQDSSWGLPSESAAIGRRVLVHTLRLLARGYAVRPNGALTER